MGAVRFNITLPDDVVEQLKRHAKDREQSAFIAKSLRYYIKKLEKESLNKRLAQEYQESAKDDLEMVKDFDGLISEGLEDDY